MKRSLLSFLGGDIRRQPAPSEILSGGRNQSPQSGRVGFTLVELLAVITILAILVGMGVGAFAYAQRRISETNTRTLIKQLEIGLEAHHQKHGYYPQNHQVVSSRHNIYFTSDHLDAIKEWVNYEEITTKNLVRGNAIERVSEHNANGIFFDGQTSFVVATTGTGYITDAYGYPLIYRCPGLVNKGSYDLGSKGPDSKWGDGTSGGPHYRAASNVGGFLASPADSTAVGNNLGEKRLGRYATSVFGLGDDITNIAR